MQGCSTESRPRRLRSLKAVLVASVLAGSALPAISVGSSSEATKLKPVAIGPEQAQPGWRPSGVVSSFVFEAQEGVAGSSNGRVVVVRSGAVYVDEERCAAVVEGDKVEYLISSDGHHYLFVKDRLVRVWK